MSNVSIEQMKVVISEFMGYYHEGMEPDYSQQACKNFIEASQYHSSWDWLMPVVKKIKSMHFDLRNSAPIFAYMEAAAPMNSGLISIDLQKLHEGVYSFLVWYNKQKEVNNE